MQHRGPISQVEAMGRKNGSKKEKTYKRETKEETDEIETKKLNQREEK